MNNNLPKNNKLSFDALLILLVGGVCAIVFFQFITLQKVYLFKDIGSDTLNAVYPHLIHVAEYLRSEGIPRWSFAQGLGQNITNSGIDNPFNWILYLLGKDYLAYGIVFVEILKILLTAWLCYRWLLGIFHHYWAAIFGAIAFALGGYMIVGGTWYVHSWLCFKVVLLLWAFEKGYRKNIWLWWSLAVFWSLDVNIVFLAQSLLVYLFFRLIVSNNDWQPKHLFFDIVQPALSYGFLGVLLKAPLLGSIFYRIYDSPRLTGGFSVSSELWDMSFFETIKHYATSVLRIFGNDLMGNGSQYLGVQNYLEAPLFYCGIITLLLVPQAFVAMPKNQRFAYGFLLIFWLLLIIFPYLRYAFYWFSGDYYKVALSAFFPIACILCACRAILAFQQTKKVHLPVLLATFLGLIGTLLAAYWCISNIPFPFTTLLFLCLGAALLFVLNKNKFAADSSSWALVALLCLEMLTINFTTINNREVVSRKELQQRIGYNDFTLEAVAFIKQNDPEFSRLSKRYSSSLSSHQSLNDAKAQNYFGTSSYSSFNQGYYVNFLKQMGVINPQNETESRWILGLHKRPLLEKLVALKYVLGSQNNNAQELRNVGLFGEKILYQAKQTMPLGFIYTQYFPENSFLRLDNEQKDCAMLNAVVISEEMGKTKQAYLNRTTFPIRENCFPQTINELKLSYFSNNELVFRGNAPKGLFFASIPFDLGWTATVDCQQKTENVAVEQVNFGFIGVSLPQNCEEIILTLRYQAPFAKIGLLIALIAWIFLVFLFYINRKRKLI